MVHYDPFSAEVMRDPYPVYQRLRDEAPVYHLEQYDAWALSRFEDVCSASMDNESSSPTSPGCRARGAGRPPMPTTS
jgi:cytochrome P450